MRYLLLLWAVVLLTGSLLPISIKAALHITNNHLFIHPAIHIAGFAALAFLLTGLAKSPPQRGLALIVAIVFGCTLELLEHVAYRQPLELSDMGLDAVGSAIGLVLRACVYPRLSVLIRG